jgi:hypothetical protein
MSKKNANDTIGNRTRDLQVCSAVPEATASPRAPPSYFRNSNIFGGCCVFYTMKPKVLFPLIRHNFKHLFMTLLIEMYRMNLKCLDKFQVLFLYTKAKKTFHSNICPEAR